MAGLARWVDRVALVTGASTGIGAAICKELVQHGMKVVGCARNSELMENIAQSEELSSASGRMYPIKCDLSKELEIQAMFDKIRKDFGRLDVCINNAGIAKRYPLLTSTSEYWRSILEVNIIALCICTREAVKLMEENKIDDGQIINVGSVSAHRFPPDSGMPPFAMYAASKSGLRTLTEGLRREIRKTSSTPYVRVAIITPGAVETPIIAKALNEEFAQAYFGNMNVKCTQPEDIAKVITFILETPQNVEINDIMVQPVAFTK